MNKRVTVIFDGGVLRPDVPLDLAPNTRYVITIQELKDTSSSGDAWDVLEAIAASGGRVLHSTEFNHASIIEGKRVVVVGFGKSACDIATLAANIAKKSTLVFRQPLWKIPRFFLGLVNLKYVKQRKIEPQRTQRSQCALAVKRLVRAASPLGRSNWRDTEG
ncbi:antitoxin family protein [Nostoc favosum]|uniref:Uncharacterized protein n=1 Tax=Nostoc favosum CHAB5714 TaxID=2780399 RepID=A0ABS8IHV7_9NOSO|nr:antitoxin family protein [Nostoc favosum]MCC5603850.1 hypothetical protein [Nostoc favosum CHAB5714]